MINCQSCGKENQKHYKFCLGCGSELHPPAEPGVGTMQTVAVDVGDGVAEAAPQGPPPGVSQRSAPLMCSACNTEIPPNFKFCGACGAPIDAEPAASEQVSSTATNLGEMTLIRPDGSEGGSQALLSGDNKIGRDHGNLFESDGYLSPSHAVISLEQEACIIRDLGSLNGVFVRITEEEEIIPGQIFRVGQELLRFDEVLPPRVLDDGTEIMGSPNPGYWGRITVIIGEECDGASFPLSESVISLGRERGDINFPDDGYVSGLHAQVIARDGRFYLSDMGSSNGTFLKVSGERELPAGAFVLLGQQLFRINF